MTVKPSRVTITFVVLELCPFVGDIDAALNPDYAGLDQSWIDAIWTLLQEFDNLSCARCVDGPVGLTLNDDEDSPRPRGTEWHETVLARKPDGSIVAMCADCNPTLDFLDSLPELKEAL